MLLKQPAVDCTVIMFLLDPELLSQIAPHKHSHCPTSTELGSAQPNSWYTNQISRLFPFIHSFHDITNQFGLFIAKHVSDFHCVKHIRTHSHSWGPVPTWRLPRFRSVPWCRRPAVRWTGHTAWQLRSPGSAVWCPRPPGPRSWPSGLT